MSARFFYLISVCALSLLTSCSKPNKALEIPARADTSAPGPTQIELSPEQESAIGLKTMTVEQKSQPVLIEATGQIQAAQDQLAHITTPVAGRVTDVLARLGDKVTRGQTLAAIKSDAIGQAESDLLQATLQNDSDIQQAKLQLNLSQTTYQREQKLFNDKISAKADLDAARVQFEKDQGALNALQLKREATILTAQQRLSLLGVADGTAARVVQNRQIDPYLTIASPQTGLLVNRAINVGELADPSKDMFGVSDLSQVWVVANIYEKDVAAVRIGQAVKLTLDSLSGQVFNGTISYVADQLDPQSRTLAIRAVVPNPDFKLKPNMFARMEVFTQNSPRLTVPHSAIQRIGTHTYAYIPVGQHRYEQREVSIGHDDGQVIQIIKGLKPSEQIVTQGTLELQGKFLKLAANSSN